MTCPTGNATYASEKAAREDAKRNRRWQLYPYRCRVCGAYHLKSGDHGQRMKRMERRRA